METFVTDLSKHWDIADVNDRLANPAGEVRVRGFHLEPTHVRDGGSKLQT